MRYDASNPSASNLKILNNAKNCSVETRYDQETGTLHIFREPDAPANGTPGGITAYVTPQDPSYCYARVSSVGGSVIMGNGKYDMAYEDLQWFNLQKVGGNGIEVFTEVPLVRYKAGPVEVYLQEWYWPYGGGAYEHVSLEKGEEMILYMPYPEGKDMNSPENFYLYHFNTKYVQQEKLLGEKTPFGLKYVIRSMSPFVLERTPEAEVTPVPQTGDSEPLGLWTALLLASAAFALLMLRRKHA